jgi:hypothetical protein
MPEGRVMSGEHGKEVGAVRRMSVQRWLAAQENHGRSNTAAADRSSARKLRGAL